jgi:hypothetical protein
MDVSIESGGVLQIEPTDQCNLACSMCLPHFEQRSQIHGIPKGRMDLALYERIVDGLVAEDLRFDHVILQWLGDPSLHPELEQMVVIARSKLWERVGYLRIDTNAITLTPARMDRLVDAYLVQDEMPLLLVFTLDAATPETYERVKGRDALEKVKRNVEHLVRRRAELPGDVCLNFQFQFVLQEGNAHEVGDFVRYWSDFLLLHGNEKGYDEILVKRLAVDAGGKGQLEADELYERTCAAQGISERKEPWVHLKVWEGRGWESTARPNAPRQPCPGLWMTPVVRHDGHLMMCCVDLPGALDLGSLGDHSFRTLWEGEEANRRRLAHVRGRFSEVGPCADCGGISWYQTPPEFVRKWLEDVGETAAWSDYEQRMGRTPA